VQCPGIGDLSAVVAVTQPSGPAHGTLFAHQGTGGTDFYEAGIDQFLANGLRVVQVRWESDWEQTAASGILAAACRPATVMKWAFDTVNAQRRTDAFCAIGHSGGTGVIAYALAHYGMGDYLDYVALNSGPPLGRIDYGCAPSAYYTGPQRTLCAEIPDAPLALPADMFNRWENTRSCRTAPPPPADIQRWAHDSVISPGAVYDYPKTLVAFWDCATKPLSTTSGAFFYSQQITSKKTVTCFTDCQFEALGPAAEQTMEADVIASCVPRH